MVQVYFRADASAQIGFGHFVRTLALASRIGDGYKKTFVTQNPSPNQVLQITKVCDNYVIVGENHFDEFLKILKEGDIVVLDNYYFETDYQRAIKKIGCKLVCIDDMHDKHYVADVVINHGVNDANLFSVESYTRLCLGIEWALVRKPFLEKHNPSQRDKGYCVVAFGGSDYHNITKKVCNILSTQGNIKRIAAVVGEAYQFEDSLRCVDKVVVSKNLNAEQMASLFNSVEFAVLPTSTIAIEAILCGCPVVGGYYIDNQVEYYQNFTKRNYISPLGDLLDENLETKLFESLFNFNTYSNNLEIEDKYNQLFKALNFEYVNYVELTEEKSKKVWYARNLYEIRRFMSNPEPFTLDSHFNFINKLKTDKSKEYWAILDKDEFVCGYNLIEIEESQVERGIFISPDYIGTGIAISIDLYFELSLIKRGISKLNAIVNKDNERSLRYHIKNGYEVSSIDDLHYYLVKYLE